MTPELRERLKTASTFQELPTLQGRILLQKYDPGTVIAADAVTATSLNKIRGGTDLYQRISLVSKEDRPVGSVDAWANQLVTNIHDSKDFFNSPRGQTWMRALERIGIKIEDFNKDTAMWLYREYIERDDLQTGAGIQHFITKISRGYADENELLQDIDAFVWIGGMFGHDASEISAQAILAFRKLQKADDFAELLKQDQDGELAINVFFQREIDLLTRLHRAKPAKPIPTPKEPPKPKTLEDDDIFTHTHTYSTDDRIVVPTGTGSEKIDPANWSAPESQTMTNALIRSSNALVSNLRKNIESSPGASGGRGGKTYDIHAVNGLSLDESEWRGIQVEIESGKPATEGRFKTGGFIQLLNRWKIPGTFDAVGDHDSAHARAFLGLEHRPTGLHLIFQDPASDRLVAQKVQVDVRFKDFRDSNYNAYLQYLTSATNQFASSSTRGLEDVDHYNLTLPNINLEALVHSAKLQDNDRDCVPLAFFVVVQRYLMQPGDLAEKKKIQTEFEQLFGVKLMLVEKSAAQPQSEYAQFDPSRHTLEGFANELKAGKEVKVESDGAVLRSFIEGMVEDIDEVDSVNFTQDPLVSGNEAVMNMKIIASGKEIPGEIHLRQNGTDVAIAKLEIKSMFAGIVKGRLKNRGISEGASILPHINKALRKSLEKNGATLSNFQLRIENDKVYIQMSGSKKV